MGTKKKSRCKEHSDTLKLISSIFLLLLEKKIKEAQISIFLGL